MALQILAWLPSFAISEAYKMAVRSSSMSLCAVWLIGGGGIEVGVFNGGTDVLDTFTNTEVLGRHENSDEIVTGEVIVAVFVAS